MTIAIAYRPEMIERSRAEGQHANLWYHMKVIQLIHLGFAFHLNSETEYQQALWQLLLLKD